MSEVKITIEDKNGVRTIESSSNVPPADSTLNNTTAQVIGNKTDAAVTTVGNVASALAYIKGLLNQAAALVASKNRELYSMDFWSPPQEEIAIPAVAADLTLPNEKVFYAVDIRFTDSLLCFSLCNT